MDTSYDTVTATISVSDYLALRDLRLVYEFAVQGRWDELRELFTPEDPRYGDGGYSEGQLRLIGSLIDRLEAPIEATPFSVETRAWIARIRAEREG